MSFQALARTWRPRRFDQLVGQEHVVRALTHALDNDKLHHALLFSGTRGVGKTSLARIIAKCLNCEHGVSATPCVGEDACATCREIDEGRYVDLIEVDAASRTGVDDTRELMDNVQYAPTRGRTKVYLIDEVHMLTKHSFNALLKTLEEPPPRVQFLLATTEPEKIPVTILSRCLQFPLKRLSAARITERLAHIVSAESLAADEQALTELARAADGSMRDGLSLLDQALAFGGGRLGVDDVREMLGTIGESRVAELVDAVIDARATDALAALEALYAQGLDMKYLLEALATAWQHVATIQVVGEPIDDAGERWQSSAARLAPELTQLFYDITITGMRDYAFAPDPLIGVRMCVLRMLAFQPGGAAGGETGVGHRETPDTTQPVTPSGADTRRSAPRVETSAPEASDTTGARLSAREAMAQARAQLAGKSPPSAASIAPDSAPTSPADSDATASEMATEETIAPEASPLSPVPSPEPPWETDAVPDASQESLPVAPASSAGTLRGEESISGADAAAQAEPAPPSVSMPEETAPDSQALPLATPTPAAGEGIQSAEEPARAPDGSEPRDPEPEIVSETAQTAEPATPPSSMPLTADPLSDGTAPGTLEPEQLEPFGETKSTAGPDHPEDWHDIVDRLELGGFAAQLANNGRCRHLDDDRVELDIARTHRFLVTDDARAQLAEALAKLSIGHDTPRVVVHVVDTLDDTPAQRIEANAEKRQQDAVASIQNDPIVHELCRQLGAQIRMETIKPNRRPSTIQQRDDP